MIMKQKSLSIKTIPKITLSVGENFKLHRYSEYHEEVKDHFKSSMTSVFQILRFHNCKIYKNLT